MSSRITVIIVRALGLSGATWFNLVLGNHDEAMALGPPARILDLPAKDAGEACFVHRERCDFWPAFLRERDHRGRFFEDIAASTGKRILVVNYPPRELIEREIDGRGFRILTVRLVRDGRAVLFSRMRHYGTLTPGTAIHHIVDWQIPVWDRVDRKLTSVPSPAALTVRYEDMLLDGAKELARVGDFVGIRYGENATRFWERPQHLTAGNTGVIDLLCRLQGETGHHNRRADTYARMAEELSVDPERTFLDESWIDSLSREDRLAFDCLLGERNALYGYPRDSFLDGERHEFLRDLDRRLTEARAVEQPGRDDNAAAVPSGLGRLSRFLSHKRAQ